MLETTVVVLPLIHSLPRASELSTHICKGESKWPPLWVACEIFAGKMTECYYSETQNHVPYVCMSHISMHIALNLTGSNWENWYQAIPREIITNCK